MIIPYFHISRKKQTAKNISSIDLTQRNTLFLNSQQNLLYMYIKMMSESTSVQKYSHKNVAKSLK